MASPLILLRNNTLATQQHLDSLHEWLKSECLESKRLDDLLTQWQEILEDIFFFFDIQIDEGVSSKAAWNDTELHRTELYDDFMALGDELNIEDESENLFAMREIEKDGDHAEMAVARATQQFESQCSILLASIAPLIDIVCDVIEFDES